MESPDKPRRKTVRWRDRDDPGDDGQTRPEPQDQSTPGRGAAPEHSESDTWWQRHGNDWISEAEALGGEGLDGDLSDDDSEEGEQQDRPHYITAGPRNARRPGLPESEREPSRPENDPWWRMHGERWVADMEELSGSYPSDDEGADTTSPPPPAAVGARAQQGPTLVDRYIQATGAVGGLVAQTVRLACGPATDMDGASVFSFPSNVGGTLTLNDIRGDREAFQENVFTAVKSQITETKKWTIAYRRPSGTRTYVVRGGQASRTVPHAGVAVDIDLSCEFVRYQIDYSFGLLHEAGHALPLRFWPQGSDRSLLFSGINKLSVRAAQRDLVQLSPSLEIVEASGPIPGSSYPRVLLVIRAAHTKGPSILQTPALGVFEIDLVNQRLVPVGHDTAKCFSLP